MRHEASVREGPSVSPDDMCEILEELDSECERTIMIVTAAAFRIERRQRHAAEPLVREELRRRLEETQRRVVEEFEIPLEEVERAWAYYSAVWTKDRSDEEAARVVEAGWKVKARVAKHMMTKAMTLRAVETMAEACIDELPDAMSNLQESLDRRGASVLKSPQMIMRVLQEALQVAMRQIMLNASRNRVEKEWGMDIKKLQEKVDEYKDDSAFTHRANEIMAKFEQKLEQEQEALLRVYGLDE